MAASGQPALGDRCSPASDQIASGDVRGCSAQIRIVVSLAGMKLSTSSKRADAQPKSACRSVL